MTVAIVALALAVAAAVPGLIALAWALRAAMSDRVAARADLLVEQRRGDRLLEERNQAIADRTTFVTANLELTRRLSNAERELNAATQETADAAADKIRSATRGADVLDELNRVLAEPLVPDDGAAHPAGAHREGREPAAVRPPDAADGSSTAHR